MVSGMKNKFILKMFIFVFSVIVMTNGYSFIFFIYEHFFLISAHNNVGMIFISFFFILIASPVLLAATFMPVKLSFTIFLLGIAYLFFEWFSIHPLRVSLMGGCFSLGYIFIVIVNRCFFSKNSHE